MNIEKKCEEFMKKAQELGYSKKESLCYLAILYCSTIFGEENVIDFKDFINFYAKKEREVEK